MHSIEELQHQIHEAIQRLPIYQQPSGLYEPISYTLGLGGKRIRPLLTLVATQMFGGDTRQALPAAIAIEIFHNFTLLHDDIIDQAPLRRGKETVFKKWNTNTAILSGDTMFAIAYGELARANHEKLPDLMEVFTKTAIEVCEGQQYDIDFESNGNVSLPGYLNMIRLKTAVLLAASLKIGAIIAGSGNEEANRIYEFGENLGVAFQLQDDLLDAFGDETVFGKKTGGDIISNKKTYLYLKTIELANKEDAKLLQSLYSTLITNPQSKINQVLALFKKYDIEPLTRKVIQDYYNRAMDTFNIINVENEARAPLLYIANQLFNRKS